MHDRWIISRLNKTARDVRKALGGYEFHEAVQTLYHFFWDDFCDWYIELTKADVTAEEASPQRTAARTRLLSVLEQALRLLHPFMPYITEELWQQLPGAGKHLLHPAYQEAQSTIMLTGYPEAKASAINDAAEWEMQALIDLITRAYIRSEMQIKPSEAIPVLIGAPDENMPLSIPPMQIDYSTVAGFRGIGQQQLEAPRASARAILGAARK